MRCLQNAGTHSFSIGVTEDLKSNIMMELSADDIEFVYQRLTLFLNSILFQYQCLLSQIFFLKEDYDVHVIWSGAVLEILKGTSSVFSLIIHYYLLFSMPRVVHICLYFFSLIGAQGKSLVSLSLLLKPLLNSGLLQSQLRTLVKLKPHTA